MIRLYTNDDLEQALKIYVDTFSGPEFNYSWVRKGNIRRYFTDLQHTPGFRAYAWESGEGIDGFCLGTVQDYFACPAYEIKEIMVAPQKKGMGIGTALLKAVEADLASMGVEVVMLATQRDMAAFGFYKKNGYLVSEGTVYLGKATAQEE